MDSIYHIFPSGVMEALGWTIIHSVWQGALIALIFSLVMLFTKRFTSVTRYIIAVIALLFMLFSVFFTFIRVYESQGSEEVVTVKDIERPDDAVDYSVTPAKTTGSVLTGDSAGNINMILNDFKNYFYRHFPLIVTFWLMGMLILMLRFIGGLAYTRRMKYYRVMPVEPRWGKQFKELLVKLGISQPVSILQSSLAKVPLVIGYIKPVVLLPVSAFTGLSEKQLESILVHELAHIIRRDYIINLFQSLIEIVLFYHPAVWWISSVIKEEREHCCDDIALEYTGDTLNYAKALAGIQEQLLHQEGLAMTISHNNKLLKRIKRLLNQPKMKTNFMEGVTASCIVFFGIVMIMLNPGIASAFKIQSEESGVTRMVQKGEIPEADTDLHTPDNQSALVLQDSLLAAGTKEDESAGPESEPGAMHMDQTIEQERKQTIVADENALGREEKIIDEEIKTEVAREISEELKREIEIELRRELNKEGMQEEVIRGVEKGLQDMDIDLIIDEALTGVEAGMREIDFNNIVDEALAGVKEMDEADINIMVNEIIYGVEETLRQMDLNAIINEVLQGVNSAMHEIDVGAIIVESLHDPVYDDPETGFYGNPEHLHILKSGVGQWNRWRENNPTIRPDLSGAYFKESDLSGADLHNVNLQDAHLKEAELDGVNFENALLFRTNLKEASLAGIRVAGADFTNANLKEVNLSGLDLRKANFFRANLKEADLSGTDLRDVILEGANLKEANLRKADLRGAHMEGVDFSEADIDGADLRHVHFDDNTLFPEDD